MPRESRRFGRLHVRGRDSAEARQVLFSVQRFIRTEETEGWPLVVCAILALIAANSPWGSQFDSLWTAELVIDVGGTSYETSARHFINDFLMPLFFFVIGLELKHAVTVGELSSLKRAAMPMVIGLGGMLVPVGIYFACNLGAGGEARGWGVPIATDVAFVLAVLTLFGERVPRAMRVLTLAFAAVDDVGGILAIAIFYSHDISFAALCIAIGLLVGCIVLIRVRIHNPVIYAALGIALIAAVYQSGVHSTIAGVVLGLIVPSTSLFDRKHFVDDAERLIRLFRDTHEARLELEQTENKAESDLAKLEALRDDEEVTLGKLAELTDGTDSLLDRSMRAVNPWVSYLVLPLFALSNAGIAISAEAASRALESSVAWGVCLGLCLGKPLGITLSAWAAHRLGFASLPAGVNWTHTIAMSLLAGIGFTVSLFIAELAFSREDVLDQAKMAIFAASVVSLILGSVVLLVPPRNT